MAFTEELHPRAGGKFAVKEGSTAKKTAAPQAGMAFDGKRGTGYGVKGGDKRVRALQEALNRLGLTDADGKKLAVDGKLGPRTTAAVKAAQRKLGLKVNGIVTPALLEHLTMAKKLEKTGSAKTTPRPSKREQQLRERESKRKDPVSVNVSRSTGMDLYERTFALDDIEIQRGGDGRTVTAYAAVFDTPAEIRDQHGHYREEIHRGAFAKTLAERGAARVAVFYNHGMNLAGRPDMLGSVPLGTPLDIKPDGRGLVTVTRYNRTPLAESVLEAIRDGQIKGQSFRGRIFKSQRIAGHPLPTVTRTELGLTEYGPTPFPAYEGAGIMAVRTAEMIAQSIAGLDPDERAELIRMLSTGTPPEPSEDETATPIGEPADESHTHSGRLTIRRNRIRMDQMMMGVRRG